MFTVCCCTTAHYEISFLDSPSLSSVGTEINSDLSISTTLRTANSLDFLSSTTLWTAGSLGTTHSQKTLDSWLQCPRFFSSAVVFLRAFLLFSYENWHSGLHSTNSQFSYQFGKDLLQFYIRVQTYIMPWFCIKSWKYSQICMKYSASHRVSERGPWSG